MLTASGIETNQSSISRDVRELGLVRVGGRYVPAARLVEADIDGPGIYDSELITSLKPVGANLIVIHTHLGAAQVVAVELDRREWPEIVGTIAGDDTVFIAVGSRAAQGRVLARIRATSRNPIPNP